MTHDPLCPEYGRDYGECFSQPFSDAFCQCGLIGKARADERMRAGRRVAALTHWADGWVENVVVNRTSAINAAEGGDGE